MKLKNIIIPAAIILSGCGDSGEREDGLLGGATPTPAPVATTPAEPSAKPMLRASTWDAAAYEKDGDIGRIAFIRSNTNGSLTATFSTSGAADPANGSASEDDYDLFDQQGNKVVNNQVSFADTRARVVLDIRPRLDSKFEVPETLTLNLEPGDSYQIGDNSSAAVTISDAKNITENNKILIGLFRPENGASTSASGSASLVIQGDNSKATLSYRFEGLSDEQVTQHVHLNPDGQILFDIDDEDKTGEIKGLVWDLAPSAFFTTRQQLLDALFAGEAYVNIHSAAYRAGEIAATLRYDATLEPPTTPPPSGDLTPEEVSRDTLRFLNQATFGATAQSYQALREKIDENGKNRLKVYEDWIDAQFELPQSGLKNLTQATTAVFDKSGNEGPNRYFFHRRDAFWTMAVSSKDQLRLRTTYALSQILVASDAASLIRRNHLGSADYWDMLGRNAFGSYRQALGDATRHTVMAVWLSYMNNDKENKAKGVSPDENYAREIMQLFTFGLVQRNADGVIKIDSSGLPLPTYDNKVIQELARVFTGYSVSVYGAPNGNREFENNRFGRSPGGVTESQAKWLKPLKMFPDHHDFGEKKLFKDRGVQFIVPASNDKSAESAEREIDLVLDALVAHSTTAPNIARLLIQRFITSNPSRAYVERVATAFGSQGDMKTALKAILLDPEARDVRVLESETFGKPKEPLIVFSHLLRALDAKSQVGLGDKSGGIDFNMASKYNSDATLLRLGDPSIAQRAFGAPSVFNFYSPDFAPPGDIASNSMVAPELQISDESQMYAMLNELDDLLNGGMLRFRAAEASNYTPAQLQVRLDYRLLNAVWNSAAGSDQDKAAAVVDYLDKYLNSGLLAATDDIGTRLTIIDAVEKAKGDDRFNLAIYGLVSAPRTLIQR